MYTDAHTHLNADQLFPQRDTHLQNFIDLGGHALINIGVNDERNQRAIQIAQQAISRFPACIVKATLGMHPGEIAF